MSTGPGPTRKAEGSADASVDDIANLLVEDESPQGHVEDGSPQGQIEDEQVLDDGLDVMLETPGPVLVNTFMPPPPAPAEGVSEESESGEEPGAETNLAYEDLLAKLVLPAKAPEAEPIMPALTSSLPLPESLTAPAAPSTPAASFKLPSSPSFQIAPPTDERTLVTDNPLVAEEQEAAVREGRSYSREQPLIVHEEMRAAPTEPMVAANGGVKSRLLYLMLGGLLVLGGMILAVLVLKLLMPTPAPQPAVVITPAPPPPPPAPPAHVEPLPPSVPPAAAATAPAQPPKAAVAPEYPARTAEQTSAQEPAQPKAHKSTGRTRTPKPAPAAKPAATPKVAAPVPAAKAPKPASGKKSGKSSGYADPFDN